MDTVPLCHDEGVNAVLSVGLTGGIATGKSAVSRRLTERGAQVVDHDRLAHDAVAPGSPGLAAVIRRFGSDLLTASGALDRAALAARVFHDDDARHDLEAIIHPEVARLAALAQLRIAEAPREVHDPRPIVVHDIPLLIETGQAHNFDVLLVIHAPLETRLERLAARGLDRAEALARIHAQATEAEHLMAADLIIDGSGSLAALHADVDIVFDNLARLAQSPA